MLEMGVLEEMLALTEPPEYKECFNCRFGNCYEYRWNFPYRNLKEEEEEFDSTKENRNVLINDKFWVPTAHNETSDWEMNRLVNPREVVPPCFGTVKLEIDCGLKDYEMKQHESISIHDNKNPKQEVQTPESNILTPPRSPEDGESSETELPSSDDLTPQLSLEEWTDTARCLGELIVEADLTSAELPYKDDSFEEKEDDDDDNDVDEEEEIIAEERMQQLYRMQEESNSSEEWIRCREKSIARPINPTENDHSYYKGLHSEETAYEYYCTPSESEESEVDVVSLPSRQQQIREQQYLMQLQQQALSQQVEKPQRRLAQRRQRKEQESTPTAQVQPVRQVRQRGRKPAAKGKSSMPNKVSPAPKELFATEISSDSSENAWIPTGERVTRGGTKRKAAKSSGPATKRRRGRVSDRDMMPAEKREQHNNMERKRRVDLANLYSNLRKTIPEIKHLEKASKAKILNLAIRDVLELRALEISLPEIAAAERRRNAKLSAKRDSLAHAINREQSPAFRGWKQPLF